MAGICTGSSRRSGAGCDHREVTVNLDGSSITLHTSEGDLDAIPWGDGEKRQLLLLSLKRARVLGLQLDQAVNRVIHGDEATNVKQYMLLGKDVQKNNIGTAYVNIQIGANGERSLVDFSPGHTQFRLVMNANLVGTGPWNFRVIRDGDSQVLYESPNITQTGERELDTDWQAIPAEFSGLTLLRFQGKSAVAADDPIVRRCILLVR